MILVLDNRDSFVFNLARHLHRLGAEVIVRSSHEISVADVDNLAPCGIVISPGPCTPTEAGCSVDVIRRQWGHVPILGVCLGHQAIAAAAGGRILRSTPCHGRTSAVYHDTTGLFAGMPSPIQACRYHSLVVDPDTLPAELRVTARTEDGIVMALAAAAAPVFGVQFHPEAILTEAGYRLLANFLNLAGIPCEPMLPERLDEAVASERRPRALPSMPTAMTDRIVTF
jgi:anthranilate synthase/aminodeoxychorismate synthase-like glutamine amidotransferase